MIFILFLEIFIKKLKSYKKKISFQLDFGLIWDTVLEIVL